MEDINQRLDISHQKMAELKSLVIKSHEKTQITQLEYSDKTTCNSCFESEESFKDEVACTNNEGCSYLHK